MCPTLRGFVTRSGRAAATPRLRSSSTLGAELCLLAAITVWAPAAQAATWMGIVEVGDANAAVRDALAEALKAADNGINLVSAADMSRHLKRAETFGIACADRAPACLVKVAALVGVRYVLRFAWSSTSADRANFTATLVDVEGAAPFPEVSVTVPAAGAARRESLTAVLDHLLKGAPLTGKVALSLSPGDALLIDGESAGRAQLDRLSLGAHVIEVRGAAGVQRATVEVLPGVTAEAVLSPAEPTSTGEPASGEPSATSPDERLPDDAVSGRPSTPGDAVAAPPVGPNVAASGGEPGEGGVALLPMSLIGAGAAIGVVGVAAGAGLWGLAAVTIPTQDAYRQQKELTPEGTFSPADVAEYEQRVFLGQAMAAIGTGVVAVGMIAAVGLVAGGAASFAIE